MRVTPPPTAHPIAAAAVPLAVALVPLAFPPPAAAVRWQRPVPGGVTRMFDYARGAPFVPGAHRGADFAAPPGATVRAACDGTVAYAGPAPGGRVVTLLCGARRVTHLPLARVTVRRGTRVRAGAPIGVLAAGHGGPERATGPLRRAMAPSPRATAASTSASARPVTASATRTRSHCCRHRPARARCPPSARARYPRALRAPRRLPRRAPLPCPRPAVRRGGRPRRAPPRRRSRWAGLALVLARRGRVGDRPRHARAPGRAGSSRCGRMADRIASARPV